MSSTELTSFAIAGFGGLGRATVNGLLSSIAPSAILVLSRDPSKLTNIPFGVTTARVDYNDVGGIADVLLSHNIDCVVSTVQAQAMQSQNGLADAAKKAGVKLFVPSEFGFPTDGARVGSFQQKDKLKDRLVNLGIPYMRCYNGVLIDCMPSIVGITNHNRIDIIGSGDVPVSFTAIDDVGGFIAFALTSLPLDRIKNTTFRLEGHRLTLNEMARLLGYPVSRVHSVHNSDDEMFQFVTAVQKWMDSGYGSSKFNAIQGREMGEQEITNRGENAREVWKGHVWKKIGDFPIHAAQSRISVV